jgi:hypothetical protein
MEKPACGRFSDIGSVFAAKKRGFLAAAPAEARASD